MPSIGSNSQQNEHVDDTRGRCRLQPPSGIATGRVRRRRSNSRVCRTLPHLVRVFLAAADHRSELAVDHQCRTSPENCLAGESPSQICSHPLDLESKARIKSLTQRGMLRSEPSRSHLDPTAENPDPHEEVPANQNRPRGSPLLKQKFELEFQTRFDPNLAKFISFIL
jgi:hypothetical protein